MFDSRQFAAAASLVAVLMLPARSGAYWPLVGLQYLPDHTSKRPFFRKKIPPSILRLVCDDPRLVILKSQRKLLLHNGDRVVKAYSIDLGKDPVSDKAKRGDGRTPEGDFYVCKRVDPSRFHRAFVLSYPSIEDAARGYLGGLISLPEYVDVVEANIRKDTPPQSTKLGGLLEIHGSWQGVDWTAGCAAVSNEDMDELWHVIREKTPVTILP